MRTLPLNAPSRQQRKPARWSELVARDCGAAPVTVETWIHAHDSIQHRLAQVIRRLVECEEVELLAKIDVLLDAARATLPIPALDDELIEKAVEADEMEAIARERYLLHRSEASLKAWRRALESQRGMGFLLLLAVQREEAAA